MARAIDAYSLNNDFVEWYNDQTDEIGNLFCGKLCRR